MCVTVSMLTVADVVIGSSTNHERQSAALFLAPEIHLKVILYVASSRLHLLTLLLAFFLFKNFARGFMIIFYSNVSALLVVISFSYQIVNLIGLLFSCAPFSLGFCECMQQEGYGEFCSIMFLQELCSACIVRCICVDNVLLIWVWVVQYECLYYCLF